MTSNGKLWIDRKSQEPLVCRIHSEIEASQYGETSLTDTREGADQSESAFQMSSYGETTMTKTREGADMTEASAWDASSYGETIKNGDTRRSGSTRPCDSSLFLRRDYRNKNSRGSGPN